MAYKTINDGNFYLVDMGNWKIKEQRYEVKNNYYIYIKSFSSRSRALEFIIKYVKNEIKKSLNKIKLAEKRIEKWEQELILIKEKENEKKRKAKTK